MTSASGMSAGSRGLSDGRSATGTMQRDMLAASSDRMAVAGGGSLYQLSVPGLGLDLEDADETEHHAAIAQAFPTKPGTPTARRGEVPLDE